MQLLKLCTKKLRNVIILNFTDIIYKKITKF